ncbi:MAG: hypothetical protein HFH53_02390 [Hespellia sp.]|nr:hypothetical protein [Hespellia sp.]
MKMRYCIGFFLGIFMFLSVLGIGYQLSYQYMQSQHLPEQVKAEVEEEPELSVKTEGEAVKNEGYYLMGLNDYVVVYLYDKQTIYEYTNIRMDTLPEELQGELQTGKYVETIEELFGFLENYSS